MAVKLFRRHSQNCSRKYPKELKIFESDSLRATKKAQCRCVISAEGTVPSGEFMRAKSTGHTQWADAKLLVAKWEKEGEADPVVGELVTEDYQLVTIAEAVKNFLAVKEVNNTDSRRLTQYKNLLELRLLPFAATAVPKPFVQIQDMDSATAWSDFRLSWKRMKTLCGTESQMKARVFLLCLCHEPPILEWLATSERSSRIAIAVNG